MSARNRNRSRRSRTATAPPGEAAAGATRSRAPGWMALAALIGFAGGAVAWWVSRPATVQQPAPIPDPAAGSTLYKANEMAIRLTLERRAVESLPWFRRQLEWIDDGPAHKDYASALHNAAIQSGPESPATRSSFERMMLLRESLHQLDLAGERTASPEGHAALLDDRAHTLSFWGMPWDALESLERAAAMPGAAADLAPRARRARHVLERPLDADPKGSPDPLGRG